MISNFELERLAKFYRLPLISICMKDELPKKVEDGCYIINMESSFMGSGTHWVALFVYKNTAYYFDSFGATPPVEIIKFVKKRKNSHLVYNNFIIQDLTSGNCGYFSLAFLLYMNQNKLRDLEDIFNEFVNFFANDTTKNDDILKSFFASSPTNSQPSILKKFIKD